MKFFFLTVLVGSSLVVSEQIIVPVFTSILPTMTMTNHTTFYYHSAVAIINVLFNARTLVKMFLTSIKNSLKHVITLFYSYFCYLNIRKHK